MSFVSGPLVSGPDRDADEAVAVVPGVVGHLAAGEVGAAGAVAFVVVGVGVRAVALQAVVRGRGVGRRRAAGGHLGAVAVGVVGVGFVGGGAAAVGGGQLAGEVVGVRGGLGGVQGVGERGHAVGGVVGPRVAGQRGGVLAVGEALQAADGVVAEGAGGDEFGAGQVLVAGDGRRLAVGGVAEVHALFGYGVAAADAGLRDARQAVQAVVGVLVHEVGHRRRGGAERGRQPRAVVGQVEGLRQA